MAKTIFGTESDGRSADSLLYGHLEADPRYLAFREGELSPVWEESERLRTLLRNAGRPSGGDKTFLEEAIERQLPTVKLYKLASLLKGKTGQNVILYVLIFPGEAKDNTGIKDLNDKILGPLLTDEFIKCRQVEIGNLFWQSHADPPPKFVTLGSDYKAAQILSVGFDRTHFAQKLIVLDRKLVQCLRSLLPRARAKARGDKDKLKAIDELESSLKKKDYRFDFYYGARAVDFVIRDPIQGTFLMLTEALKGAGMARFMAKADGATGAGQQQAHGLKADPKSHDQRGRGFDHPSFISVIKRAGRISKLIRTARNYLHIWVDTVWTVALFEFRRDVYMMNRDVIRDVRKKLIDFPKQRDGWKSKGSVKSQIELLEMWLVTVNALDLVKDFLAPEFAEKTANKVASYHSEVLEALEEVSNSSAAINWPRLARLLTRDFRQGPEPLAVNGRASQYRFFAYSSDQMAQIFFSMDIRDLGVDLALLYDWAIGEIEVQQPRGIELMMKTIESSDIVNRRKRFTYVKVVSTFRKYFDQSGTPDALSAAVTAFGGTGADLDRPKTFEDSVQVMMGGDEIFVAAHPIYSKFICAIVGDLRAATFKERPLDMRTGVSFSRARKKSDPKAQKNANWKSHDQTLGLATSALSPLKKLERAHRRIERLIEKLDANKKKQKLVAPYTTRLEKLGLMRLFARAQFGSPGLLPQEDYVAVIRQLLKGLVVGPYTELVDDNCKVVDVKALWQAVDKLGADLNKDVGMDNYFVEPPPVINSMPPIVKKLLDTFLPPEKYPYSETREEKWEREVERERQRRERGGKLMTL